MSKLYGNVVLWTTVAVIALWIFMALRPAHAQGLGPYMGHDGRVHAQVIAGADGSLWPVIPTFCPLGWGPCPVPLAAPFAPLVPPPPPAAYAPSLPPPAPVPLGWIWRTLAPCADPDCRSLVVQVSVDGANIRAVPAGPVVGAIATRPVFTEPAAVPVLPWKR